MKPTGYKTTRWLVGLLAISSVDTSSGLYAQRPVDVFAPPEAITVQDGNSSFLPFQTAGRFQQVYVSSAFSVRFPLDAGYILLVGFRGEAVLGRGFDATLPNVQLNLSTTMRSPDGLSSEFANNVGSDDTAVLGPTSVRLLGAGGGGGTCFCTFFDFRDRAFYFNPAVGNLLLDFRVYQGFTNAVPYPGWSSLDAFNVVGDSISSVYATGDPRLLTTGQASSLGLATDIILLPVPKLTAFLQSSNLLIRWKCSENCFSFVLQESTQVGPAAAWQPVDGIVTTNSPYQEVTVPLVPNAFARFFRLAIPPPSSGLSIDPLSTQNP